MTVNTVCSEENDGHGHERQALKNVSRWSHDPSTNGPMDSGDCLILVPPVLFQSSS